MECARSVEVGTVVAPYLSSINKSFSISFTSFCTCMRAYANDGSDEAGITSE